MQGPTKMAAVLRDMFPSLRLDNGDWYPRPDMDTDYQRPDGTLRVEVPRPPWSNRARLVVEVEPRTTSLRGLRGPSLGCGARVDLPPGAVVLLVGRPKGAWAATLVQLLPDGTWAHLREAPFGARAQAAVTVALAESAREALVVAEGLLDDATA